MDTQKRIRIYFTGVGGQGSLTATSLLARTALYAGCDVVAGEVHGMAQRGGVVESVCLLGGWRAPKLDFGEADLMLGFEPLETLRGLPYLRSDGVVFSSSDPMPPVGVNLGVETYPSIDEIKAKVGAASRASHFLPCRELGEKAGAVQYRPARRSVRFGHPALWPQRLRGSSEEIPACQDSGRQSQGA